MYDTATASIHCDTHKTFHSEICQTSFENKTTKRCIRRQNDNEDEGNDDDDHLNGRKACIKLKASSMYTVVLRIFAAALATLRRNNCISIQGRMDIEGDTS